MSAIQSPGLTAEDVTAELESRRAARASEFLTLCRRIAGGERPKVAEIEKALEHAGKSPADLKTTVETIERRQRLAASVSAADGLDGDEASARERLAIANDALAEATRKHAKIAGEARARLGEITTTRRHATDARRELLRTCVDSVLMARHRAVTAALDRDEHRRRTAPVGGPVPEGVLTESELDDLRAELGAIEAGMLEP